MQRTIYLVKYSIFSFLCALLFSNAILAQTGSIEGFVRDKGTNEALPGASVSIEGTSTGISTDPEGHFRLLNLKAGTYKIKVSYIAYNSYVSEGIVVSADNVTIENVFLVSSSISLSTVNVSATRTTSTAVAVNKAVRISVGLASGVSSQLIAKLQDRDAADVAKRVPGITVMNDKFIIVRGLAQRYNTVWLNNAATPSSETDTKAFSFDIIPSSMIDNLIIYKTAEADFPADYSGGFIKIATKAIPDQNNVTFSYSTSINQGTTFQDFYKYPGSKTDWLGYDNGFRAIPREMPANLDYYSNAQNPALRQKVAEIGKSMNKSWMPNQKTATPDQRFSLGISHKFNLGNTSLGNISAVTYSNSYSFINYEKNNNYTIYSYRTDNPSLVDEFQDKQYTNTAKISALCNWAYYLNQNNRIEFRNMFNQIGYTRTTMREGREWYTDNLIRSTELGYLSRSIYSGQLGGLHNFGDGSLKIEWTLGYSLTNKKEPDIKRYKYIESAGATNYFLQVNGDLAPLSRRWLDLNENLFSGALNITKRLNIWNSNTELKVGVYYETKDRTFTARNFSYEATGSTFAFTELQPNQIFTNANFNLTDGIQLVENVNKSDSYTADANIKAGYAMVKIPIGKIDFNLGIRAEQSRQALHSYETNTDIPSNPVIDTLNFFPSVNVLYNISKQSQVRVAYGKTINRPEFREMAPFFFADFNLNAGVSGKANIKQAYVSSYDLRYELYPTPDEIFTVGVFYKHFINAIEFIIKGNNPTLYSFDNIESADSYGAEIELRKNLGFLGLRNFDALFNGSLIKSDIKAGEGELNRSRPLQGQSPYIINAGLFYQGEKNGVVVNLIYNVVGKRIVAVGRPSPNQWEDIPDIYETPRHVLDLSLSKKIGQKIEIKGGIKDLLNQKFEYAQNVKTDVNMSNYGGEGTKHFDRKQVTKLYYPGRVFTLGFAVKL